MIASATAENYGERESQSHQIMTFQKRMQHLIAFGNTMKYDLHQPYFKTSMICPDYMVTKHTYTTVANTKHTNRYLCSVTWKQSFVFKVTPLSENAATGKPSEP